MLSTLRNLSATQQIGLLFVVVFGLLVIATATTVLLSLRERGEDAVRATEVKHSRALLGTSWLMVGVFWMAWALGDTAATVLFALISFFALREFITLSPTRRGDHRSLVLAFFVVLPLQFWLVATRRFDLFSVFIPVYAFLALPVASALAGDTQRFLERNAKLQWGVMVCIYGMSHVPALLVLDFSHRNYVGKGAFLVFFLVFVVQSCMLMQHYLTRRLGRAPSVPTVSTSFNWYAWLLGMLLGSFVGGLMSFITPFKAGQAVVMAFIACAAGSLGHLVMKALKRDRGVTAWGQRGMMSVTGANGLLDRVDALCFAAPIFFHSVRWYFGA